MTKRKLSWVLAAAVSMTLAGIANAQYRVGTDGRALDANNRVGSGGLNHSGSQPLPYGVNGNNIVTGNVTGGREFRGFVPYSDPGAFRGATAGSLSDRFIRNSSAAPFGGAASNNAQVVQPYYGSSRAAPPPPGFTAQSIGSGAYVPAPVATRGAGDLRMGQVYSTPTTPLPLPGQLVLPGPVDPNTQTSSIITASPLYGVRQWDLKSAVDQTFINDNLMGNRVNDRVDPGRIEELRGELMQDQAPGEGQPDGAGTMRPFETPDNSAVSGARVGATSVGGSALGGNSTTGGSVKQRVLASPRQQSAQYDELSKRLQQYKSVKGMNDANAAQSYNAQMRAKKEAEEKAAAGAQPKGQTPAPQGPSGVQPVPGMQPVTPGANVTPQPQPPVVEVPGSLTPSAPQGPAPLKINSLAEGVQARGFSEVLKEAETLMKGGKYGSALEQYELAEQIAPNNPLILVGKANVELAQSYFNKAEGHLRQAFLQNQELLMGQYDLRSWIGDDRLTYLVNELKEITNREQKQDKPAFLLAYIMYNTGNERRAAAYLELAEKRSGGKDPLYDVVRKHWSLPALDDQGSREELNK